MHLTPDDNLVEMSILCGDPNIFKNAMDFVERKILNDRRTEEFATWFSKNSIEIGKAGL
jgi:hypothetical protein